uniref:CaM kinase-like vesicle-associated protein n=3 Tax=Bos TaxID=9903 RepID=A0AAA9S4P9_BOVIN
MLNRGVISDWDALEVLWQHLFYCRLGVQPEELAVLVADSPISPRTNREKVAEILFERFHVPAMQTVHQALLALYAYGRTTGLVLGSGHGTSYVAPIVTGDLAPLDTYRLDVAGCDLTEHLAQLLLAGGQSPLKAELVNQIKETWCYVAMDMKAELARMQSQTQVDFVLPDKQVITLGSERFCCPEALFQPNLLGVNQPGLPQLALLSISRLEAKQQEQLLANVVLDGGSTLLTGFPERLRQELGPGTTVLGSPHRAVAAWLGGSIMASRNSFQSLWFSRPQSPAMPFGCVTLGDKKNYNQPSEVTDRYDLGQVIKTEEFCEIFRAKDKTTGKLHTCKKFQKRDGRKVRKAAKNEIGILKMVKHPNILQLVDVFVTRKEYFIFLELATGREVFDWILDQGYYSERDTSNVVRQVLEAVAYLHSLKIVHRNLKLENLVYYNRLKNSKIVISDFHLAKLENGLIKEPCGTPEYLAPEVVGRQRYGRPVDCWAIGVIMYILLSGNPPFYEEVEEDDYENHDKNLFRKILAGDYEFDSPYWDDISQAAKDLVTRLMEVEQDQRITAEEAISHEWISGNAASDKNIKDGVCAQIEKNFARAKWKKAVRVTTLMKRLRAPEQSGTAAAQSAPGTDTATPGAAGGATAASAAASALGGSATPATAGDATKSENVAPADRSATPATDGSTTPATDGSVTPATDGSITPATDGSVTPATDRSVTPATDGRATPGMEESTVPTTQSSATPAAKAVATPEPALTQPDSTAPGGATGQAPPSSKGEEAAGCAQESRRVETS